MFSYGYGRRLSSRPHYLTAPNGLNLSHSIHNPKSRLRRMLDYLSVKGEATKGDIIRECFGKTIGRDFKNGDVTRGWATYLFTLSVRNGYVKMVRRGNRVFYSVG